MVAKKKKNREKLVVKERGPYIDAIAIVPATIKVNLKMKKEHEGNEFILLH